MTLSHCLLLAYLCGALPWALGWGFVAIHRMTGGRWSNDETPVRMIAYTALWPIAGASLAISKGRRLARRHA